MTEKTAGRPRRISHREFQHIPTLTPTEQSNWALARSLLESHWSSNRFRRMINGRYVYFGPLDQPGAAYRAVTEYLRLIKEGVDPTRHGQLNGTLASSRCLKDACAQFLNRKREAVARGDLADTTLRDYHGTCKWLTRTIGKNRDLQTITDRDYQALLATLVGKSVYTRDRLITTARTTLRECCKMRGLPEPAFPDDFALAPRKARRIARKQSGKRNLSPAQMQALLRAATPRLRAFLLLAINSGMGSKDMGTLRRDAIDLSSGIIDGSRNKTGFDRRVILWPETVKAIRPLIQKSGDLAFLTLKGQPLVHITAKSTRSDAVYQSFVRCRVRAKLPGVSMYDIRRTFATVAKKVPDSEIERKLIMGHAIEGVHEKYIQAVDDAQLRRVTDFVRSWLMDGLDLFDELDRLPAAIDDEEMAA